MFGRAATGREAGSTTQVSETRRYGTPHGMGSSTWPAVCCMLYGPTSTLERLLMTKHRTGANAFAVIVLSATFMVGCPFEDRPTQKVTCTYGGKGYALGATFPAMDGCNTCMCGVGGAVACTEKACPSTPACRRTGCSGQVCADQEVVTTCEWKPEYACYDTALCERQADGGCGFTPTPELTQCLAGSSTNPDGGAPGASCSYGGKTYQPGESFPSTDGCNTCTCVDKGGVGCTKKNCPVNACRRSGCSGQICADQDVVTTCEFRPEYACYQKAACGRQPDGNCGFTSTPELTQCLAEVVGKPDGGQACDFSTTYDYGDIGGLRISVERSFLKPDNSYTHTRTAVRGDQPDVSCSPALPPCGALDVITAYDIEVHDLPHADVQAALKQVSPPLFGHDGRPVDGTVFEFKRGDGRGFLVGTDCATASQGCVAIPAGIKRLRDRLRGLDAQQLESPACQSVGLGR
jgi:hypothetical protein